MTGVVCPVLASRSRESYGGVKEVRERGDQKGRRSVAVALHESEKAGIFQLVKKRTER